MVDDDVWQYLVSRFPRVALGDAHEALPELPVTVVLTIHIPCLEMRLQMHSETVGGRSLENRLEVQRRHFSFKGLYCNRDSVSHLIIGHDCQFYAD